MKAQRRSILKRLMTSFAGIGIASEAVARPLEQSVPEAMGVVTTDDVPLYSSVKKLGNLLFLFGIGAHFEGDVKAHTDHVLNELEKELVKAGSSMEKVLKVSVFLHDPNDYKAMNDVYKGRFGSKPPVRTTVAVRGGVPGDSLVEIDCIAHL
ncbi:RidA family protein [Spirosoma sp. KUDC1026]|uniref:RidA family protein n=1 Tax=Spirosoma sp. KUDC1026 TaxID=2745947 RepID=UPI00159BA4E3|nr:RidA family protein [Spirosoma sp. KUDC1026]QKZ14774.1 RidA family protein [Spirosoma sp. KUDC1026]